MWARPDSIDELLSPAQRDALPAIGEVPEDDRATALHRLSLVTDLPQGAIDYFVLAGGGGHEFAVEVEMRIAVDRVIRQARMTVTLPSLVDLGSDHSFRALEPGEPDAYVYYFARDPHWLRRELREIDIALVSIEPEVVRDHLASAR